MKSIDIGADVSKGYADFCFTDDSGSEYDLSGTYDDTPEGHSQIRSCIEHLSQQYDEQVQFQVGVECTGGMEKNWLDLFRDIGDEFNLTSFQINPLVIRRYTEQHLHHNTTDEISARDIAEYLREGIRNEQTYDPQLEGSRKYARLIKKRIDQKTALKNDFHSMLIQVHPYLVRFVRNGIPKWVLRVVKAYPTATNLADASTEQVADIPYVTSQRAQDLIREAEESVASGRDKMTGLSIQTLAEEILQAQQKVKQMKEQLWEHLKDDEPINILRSFPGIDKFAACVLRVEIGSILRFPSPEKLVANFGLDSTISWSGDSTSERGISKRGSSIVRWILYICEESARQKNPVIKRFYQRLKNKGKPHMVAAVAGMRKMLHILYACWVKNESFDPGYEKRLKKEIEEKRRAKKEQQKQSPDQNDDRQELQERLKAPISRQEAQKRKEATLPQGEEDTSHSRGPIASDDSS